MQKIKEYVQIAANSRFVKNLSITFFESIITKFFGFFITLILVRQLGPANYGVYSFILINIFTLSALFDFGMENTAIRYYNKEKYLKNSVFGLYFITKVIILFLVMLILILWGRSILITMHKPELIKYIPYFSIGLLGESLFFVNDTYLQAVQKFKFRAIINITRYIVLFSFVITLFLNKLVSLKYILFVFIIPILFTLFFIPRYFIFIKSFFSKRIPDSLLGEIFHYEKWMLVLASINGVFGRIDIYMLSFWVSYTQLGIYSAAYNLLSIISFLPTVLGKVMLPKLAETESGELFDLTLRIAKPISALSSLLLLAIPLFPFILPILFGSKYHGSILIVQILSLDIIASFIILPFEQSMYSLGKPNINMLLRTIQLIIIIVLNFITIPKYGMVFAAINMVIARVVFGVLMFIQFQKGRKEFNLQEEEPYKAM